MANATPYKDADQGEVMPDSQPSAAASAARDRLFARIRRRARRVAILGVAGLTALGLATACSSSKTTSSTSTGTSTSSTPAGGNGIAVPAAIKQAGVLRFGINTGYPPWDEAATGGGFAGADYDLGQEIAHRLGVRGQWQQIQFGTLITSLNSGRIDLIMSGMSDTKEREQVINFIDYYSTPWGFLVKKGNPLGIKSLDDVCGKRVSAESGTVGVQLLQKASDDCKKAGKPGATLTTFDSVPQIELAIRSGRTDLDLENFDALSYVAKTLGNASVFDAVALDGIPASPYGIGVSKKASDLQQVVQEALAAMIKDGTYQQILNKNGITAGGVTSAVANGATS